MALAPGDKLGPYEILAPIGAGGMAQVYRARDTRLGRDVALKVSSERFTERIVREARAIASLSHPNICALYDVGPDYLVMELLSGQPLDQRIGGKPLPLGELLDLAIAMADALDAAHSTGVIHRDLKPGNIVLTSRGQPKVLDFGLAKLTAEHGHRDGQTQTLLTEPGTAIGTAAYMSPEQARGEEVDARSDLFSFGAMLYEMATGRRAFPGNTAALVFQSLLSETPAAASYVNPDVSAGLDRVIATALEKDRAFRYQSAAEMLAELKRIKRETDTGRQSAASGTTQQTAPPTIGRGRSALAVGAGLVALIVAGIALNIDGVRDRLTGTSAERIESIAVLPFFNATGDAGMEYLSDGLAESLISSLSEVRSLRVMAPGTVFAYKGRAADPRAVGRDLKVAAVLQGKVERQGDTLIVQTDLVGTADGVEMWGERYTRKLADALSIQIDISREIASKLRVRVNGEAKQVLARHSTTNPAAYESYLKGLYYSKQLSSEGLNAGVKYFEQAIALDRNYALAYVGLSYALLGAYDWLGPPHDLIPQARVAIDKAIDLDQSLGEAHAMLAAVHFWYDYDPPAAEREFLRAIELSPDYDIGHEFHGWYLVAQKRFDAGLAEHRRAIELNPLDPEPHAVLGQSLYYSHRYDEARSALLDSIKLSPNYWFAYDLLGFVYQAQGDLSHAMEQYRKARELEGAISEPLAAIGQCYAMQGKLEAARQVLIEMTELSKHSHVAAYHFALVYAALGDKEHALAELEKSVQAQAWYPTFMGLDPKLDGLRSEPKFHELQRRAGVP